MKTFATHKFLTIFSLLIFLFSSLFPSQSFSPAGTILRTTKQQVLASLQPSHETTPTSSSSQLFLTSPSGQYAAYLLRETSNGAGGFGSDFCYIQVQESSVIIWVSKCASISNINTCSLVFSDVGLEIFDGSRSAWDTKANGKLLKTLNLLDSGDMQIRGKDGKLVWKASDNPIINQNCGSQPSSGFNQPFSSTNQPLSGFNQPFSGFNQPFSSTNQPLSGFNQPFSSQNQPFGTNNQQGLVGNTPFGNGVSRKKPFMGGDVLASLIITFGFIV